MGGDFGDGAEDASEDGPFGVKVGGFGVLESWRNLGSSYINWAGASLGTRLTLPYSVDSVLR
jgi:hypothetical protein